jgi:hypothetical protein
VIYRAEQKTHNITDAAMNHLRSHRVQKISLIESPESELASSIERRGARLIASSCRI